MQFVAERILPAYLATLDQALADAVERLPMGPVRLAVHRLRRRLSVGVPKARFDELHQLAMIGEAQGWLTAGEAIILRKLAYRVAMMRERLARPAIGSPRWDRELVGNGPAKKVLP